MRVKVSKILFSFCAILVSYSVNAQPQELGLQFTPFGSSSTSSNGELSVQFDFARADTTAGNDDILAWNVLESSFNRRQEMPWNRAGANEISLESGLTEIEAGLMFAQASGAATETEAEVPAGMSAEEQRDMAALGEAMANPLSNLWLLFSQLDSISYDGDVLEALGEDDVVNNTLLIQPVLSIQLTQEWKMVFRPVIPINSFETVGNVDLTSGSVSRPVGVDLDRETGLGDIVLWTAFSKQYTPPNIFGFGLTMMLDTATEDQLGTGKNSIGPMAMAFRLTPKWILGVVAQHWESVGGSDSYKIDTDAGRVSVDRADVSLTDIQPVIRYRMSPVTNIGMAPNWRYNHETDEASIPIGFGFDTLIKWGKLPIKVGAEVYHYARSDDRFGGDTQVRLLFIPVIPSPGWSKTPIF